MARDTIATRQNGTTALSERARSRHWNPVPDGGQRAPLDFQFRVVEAHASFPVARLRLAARIRDALWRAGIETLGELDGLRARDLARMPRLDGASAVSIVAAVRWRCCANLPSWPLLRETPVSRLWISPVHVRTLRDAHYRTLGELAPLTPETFAAITGAGIVPAERLLDRMARLAETAPERLRAIASAAEPYELPRIDPVVLLALAHAEHLDQRIVALTLGLPVRDSAILLWRWGIFEQPPPTLEALGAAFGLTGERVRQVVTAREALIGSAGLRVAVSGEERADPRNATAVAVVRRLGLGACTA